VAAAAGEKTVLSWIWGAAAVVTLWWPGRISGLLDGAPLDGLLESVALGLIVPALWWFHPEFFNRRVARIGLAALFLLKVSAAFFAQEGWCVRFDPPKPMVRGTTARPHSWDVRADWRSANPSCSAVMTSGYAEFKRFPVWFFNLPPTDDNLPTPEDRPPGATLGMTVVGFLSLSEPGLLEIVTGPGMDMTLVVDGRPADHADPLSHKIQLDPGVHFAQASGTLTGDRWRFEPSWNRALLGANGFPLATIVRPAAIDRSAARTAIRWGTTLATAFLVLGWLVSALSAWTTPAVLAWVGVASLWLAYVAPRAGNQFVTSDLARWSIAALACAALIPAGKKLDALRGLFVLVGIPWLVFIGVASIDHVGKFSLYAGGDDMWMFQRLSYRTYLEGYFLEGGQPTFNHQPLYRWIAGGLHLLFGDSSIGEFFGDGVWLLAMALFAGEATRRLAGPRWGAIASVLTLTFIVWGPAWMFFGVGLSETASAGLIYMAALTAITAERWPSRIAAGFLATLGFYTRLNNLPIAVGVAVFAVPLAAEARYVRSPARWAGGVRYRVAIAVTGTLAAGALLFALRTWHYTGVFSMSYGLTQFTTLSVWQSGMSWMDWARSMSDSALMVLTMNDPPRVSLYSIPMLTAAGLSIGALLGIKGVRRLSLPLAVFFLAGCSGALIARGSAYAGRFSTILIGATGAVIVSALAMATEKRPGLFFGEDRKK